MKNASLRKIIFAALMAALTTVATMIIRIPTPTQGYIHLGDGMVLLCGALLGPGSRCARGRHRLDAERPVRRLHELCSGYIRYQGADRDGRRLAVSPSERRRRQARCSRSALS